jgi:CRP-like cAMP-binding protein
MAKRIYNGSVLTLRLFQESNEQFLADIGCLLRLRVFNPDQWIYKMKTNASDIFCIASSQVLFYSDDETCFLKMSKGSHFGDYEVFEEIPRLHNAKTETVTHLLVLTPEALEIVEKYHPYAI